MVLLPAPDCPTRASFAVPDFEIDALQYIGSCHHRKTVHSAIQYHGFGEIRAALIDGDIQDLLCLGDRVQHIGEIGPQLLQGDGSPSGTWNPHR